MEYIQKFKDYLFSLKVIPSKVTVKNYSIDVKHFLSWFEEKFHEPFDPKVISIADIENFRKEKSQQLSQRSLDRHISSLRKFFYSLKLQGVLPVSPFETTTTSQVKTDPYHLKEFKDFLYVYNASNLTIKNYIIDLKQFFSWAEEIIKKESATIGTTETILPFLNNALLQEYRDRLASENVFSIASINRKLSSLRKYINWANTQNLLENGIGLQMNPNEVPNIISTTSPFMPNSTNQQVNAVIEQPTYSLNTEKLTEKIQQYSSIPPIRLAQKISNGINFAIEGIIITPVAQIIILGNGLLWKIKGKPLFVKQTVGLTNQAPVKNISKTLYNPLGISIKSFPLYKKIWHHARYTRPNWYKRYHSYALAHYFNWAILIIIMTALGFGFYNSFVQKPNQGQPVLAGTTPPHILSFQGRLTDTNNNPITTFTYLRFAIYNDLTATGSALQWQEVDAVTPDSNGVFSILLGQSTSLSQGLFANNSNLFLGISVGQTTELTPRQQLASVAYASNAETLQGLPPITQSGAGTNNVVLALNSSGNLSIGAASTFQTVGGAFTLSGDTLVLNTNPGTNGNIAISPNGQGFIDLQKPLINSTKNNNISSAAGAVEADSIFAVLATSSGQSAVTINQNGAGPIISASSSGISRFTVGNSGAITDSSYTANGGLFYADSNGLFTQTLVGLNGQCLVSSGGGAPVWTSCSSASSNLWTSSNGTLFPINSTFDLLVGASATTSAKFGVLNVSSGTPTASVSSGLNGNGTFLTADGTLQTARFQGLTIGGQTTGNITLTPLNGTGTVTVNGTGLQTTGSTFNLFTNTATTLNLGVTGGTTTVNSALTITGNITPNGQFAASLIPTSNSINLGSSSNNFGSVFATNLFLPSTSQFGGFWQLNNGALSPTNITNDLLAGGTATTSARFAVLNMTGSATPVASVSSGLNGNGTFLTADGTLQTARFQGLTIGGQTTGNITLTPLNGTGTVTFSGYTKGIIHSSTTGVLSSSAVNLAGGTTEISGFLPVGNGGLGADVTPAGAGEIIYSNSSTTYTHLAAAGSNGLCLTSGGAGAPSWTSCSSASSNLWNTANGALYPINSTFDLLVGASATTSAKFGVLNVSSGTPTASVSSGLNGNGMSIDANGNLQTTRNQGLTIGGGTTGNITLSPLNSGAGSTVNLNTATIDDNQSTVSLLPTPTNVTFAGAATTLAIGFAGAGTTTFRNATLDDNQATVTLFATPTSITLGGAATTLNLANNSLSTTVNIGGTGGGTTTINNALTVTGNFTPNGLMATSLVPTGNGSINLGSGTHYYGTVYANTFISPVGGGVSGFWQLTNNVLSPVNVWNDLAVGGNATGSATPWQVFATTVGVNTAGTATTSGNITFRGTPGAQTAFSENLLNGSTFAIKTSVGGDSGLTSVLSLANNGNLTLSGATIDDTNATINLWATPTTITLGGAATAVNLFTAANDSIVFGNSTGGTVAINSHVSSNFIPDANNARDLGSSSLFWRNLDVSTIFANNINLPVSGGTGGYWTLTNNVLSPTNLWNDLAVGANATGSATPFQVFSGTVNTEPAGTASTSGYLTRRGTPGSQTVFKDLLLNGSNLGFYSSVGGDTGATNLSLYVQNNGNVGIGTSNPGNELQINGSGNQSIDLNVNGRIRTGDINGAGGIWVNSGQTQFLGQNGPSLLGLYNSGFAENIDTNRFVYIGTSTLGNAALVVNQTNTSGLGDIFTASASGATKFTIANDGTIKNSIIPNITDTYDLGSNPSTGGKEWNNLYVRQIITPANGGIAGFWQLNSGALAPSNITNDLLIGSAATSSALFHVFGASINQGTQAVASVSAHTSFAGLVADNTVGDVFTASTSGLDRFVVKQNGSVGINIDTPTNTLQVAGDLQVGKDTTNWGISGYSQRRQITVTNNSGGALTNYQVKVIIDTASLISANKMLSSCNDIRFTDTDGITSLGYWLENGCNTNYTTFWVKVPTIGFQTKTIYAYYNNASATNNSSTANTFVDQISGVQAAYRLDEPTYDPIVDYSTNGNVATASGTTVLSPGKFGNARTFNGTSDYIAASDSASLEQATPLTISAWFKTTSSGNMGIVRKDTSTGTRYLEALDIGNTSCTGSAAGKVSATYYNGTIFCASSSQTYNDGNWHYAVMSISGTSIFLSVDNNAEKPTTITGTQNAPTGEFNIGDFPPNVSAARAGYFNGSIDETRVYNASISAQQATELYGNGGNNYGYVTTNNPNKELVAAYTATAPSTYLNPEQSTLQTIPSFFVQNTTGNVALGTLSVASTSARLTVAGDIKSGLYDTTAWGANWTGYPYRARIKVDNTKASTDLTNYIVRINTNTSAPIANGKMRSDCGDIRFADADGNTSLSFWIEPNTCNTATTSASIKVPTIPGSAQKNIYMYYGNPSVTTTSSTGIFTRTIAGLQGAWHFDETTSGSYADTSGNNYTMTSTSSAVIGGIANNGVFLNNQSLATANQFLISPAMGTLSTNFSVSLWFNSQSQNGVILNELGQSSLNNGFHQAMLGLVNGAVNIRVWGNPTPACTSIGTMKPGWNHVVITASNGSITGYLNGVNGGTASITRSDPSTLFFGIGGNDNTNCGGSAPAAGTGFNGSVDEFRYYNSALTSAQVTDLYNNTIGYGYVTLNSPFNEYVRTFNNPEPVTTVDTEQDPSQVDPTLYVNNTYNRVGINTANPTTALEIDGNGSGNSPLLTLFNTGGTTPNSFGPSVVFNNNVANTNPFIVGQMQGGNNQFYIADANSPYTQYLTVSQSGNVGIGTTAPGYLLQVGVAGPNSIVAATQFDSLSNPAYFLAPASTGTSLTVAGNVGIGTTNPGYQLVVQRAGGAVTNGELYITDGTHWMQSNSNMSAGAYNPLVATGDHGIIFSDGSSGTGNLVIAPWSGASNGIKILANGNVGVGTSTINSTLEVGADLNGSAMSSIFRANAGTLGSTAGNEIGPMGSFIFGTGNVVGLGIRGYREANGSDWTTAGIKLSFDVDASEAPGSGYIALEHNGNVGIGSTSPGGKLDVNGNSFFRGQVNLAQNDSYLNARVIENFNLAGTPDQNMFLGYNGGASANTYIYSNGTTARISVLTGGNVGINGGSSAQLHVINTANTGASTLELQQAVGVGPQVSFFDSTNNKAFYIRQINSDLQFVNNAYSLIIDNFADSGNLGVGTSGSNWPTQIWGNGCAGCGGGAQLLLINTAGGGGWELGPDNSNNNIVAYSEANGTGGAFICNTCTTWQGRSDQRIKKDITPLANYQGLDAIRQLIPVTYHWKDSRVAASDFLHIGFIAQNVQTVLPDLVRSSGNYTMHLPDGSTQIIPDTLALDYTDLIAPTILALKQLDASNSANLASIQQLQNLELTQTGDISITEATPSAAFTIPHYFTLNDALGNPISRMGAFVELAVGNLRAGSLSAQQVLTNSLVIATENISIAGQTLRDYILNVVRTSDLVQNGTLSPIANIDQLHTNLISPLASNSAIAVDLQNSQFTIRNSASGSAVASIDNTGNATFSGQLNSKNLAVNGDATVSGTLHADKIEANSIVGIQAIVSTLSAQNITNVTNIIFATPSGIPSSENYAMGQNNPSSTSSSLLTPYLGYTNIASYSSFLAYVPNLSASTALFDQGLVSLGTTSLGDTTVTGQLSIGTQLILANNSINVLGSSFEIQPLRQGGINFEGGLLAIDTDGNLTVNGNAVFAKNLAANIISPLSNDKNLIFKLGENPTATGSALATSTFSVQNASGSGVFAINQLGDIVSSGAANINKLNFNLVQPALAISDNEIVATGSAGTAAVKSHKVEITIDNPLVTDKSLIYITPVGATTVTPYLLRQVAGQSFTIGIPVEQLQDTTFNWLIIN